VLELLPLTGEESALLAQHIAEHKLATVDEYIAAVSPMAKQWDAVPGLIWKTWTLNADTERAGAVCLFESAEARQAYLDSDLAAAVANHPTNAASIGSCPPTRSTSI
jgi:hypothetical protein